MSILSKLFLNETPVFLALTSFVDEMLIKWLLK